jgi:hypothetical protein
MLDLYNNKYDRQTLKDNIYAVKLVDILKTQTIDVTFAVRYILAKKYYFHDDDKKITTNTVLRYQPHISAESLYQELVDYKSDDDSIDDFETYSNRN